MGAVRKLLKNTSLSETFLSDTLQSLLQRSNFNSTPEELQKLKFYLEGHLSHSADAAEALKTVEGLTALLQEIDYAYQNLELQLQRTQTSRELEVKAANELNSTIQYMMDSLAQGLFTFDRRAICSPYYSKACENLLKTNPSHKPLSEVLRIPPEEVETFKLWIDLLFGEGSTMTFETAADFGPKTLPDPEGRHIILDYRPILDDKGERTGVVVVATDKTAEHLARREAMSREAFAEMVIQITRNRDYFLNLVRDLRILILDMRNGGSLQVDIMDLRRSIHTLKGGVGTFQILKLRDMLHEVETHIDDSLNGKISPERCLDYLKDAADEIEKELNEFLDGRRDILGEDFESRGNLKKIPAGILYLYADEILSWPEGKGIGARFLRDVVATPVFDLILAFEPDVQSLARKLGKCVSKFQVVGDDIPMLEEVYRDFFSSLIHIFRNMVDHGIESPMERLEVGKQESGQVLISVQTVTEGGRDFIEMMIEDDGRGINFVSLKKKIKSKMPNLEVEKMNEFELAQFLFEPGFSTRDHVSEISGRGVGLDAVKAEALALGGDAVITSKQGQGFQIVIKVPYVWDIQKVVQKF